MKNTRVIAIANQKGGVAKTTTTRNLGTVLANQDKKVLLIDSDPQGSLSICCGYSNIRALSNTLADILISVADTKQIPSNIEDYILPVETNLDLIAANGSLTNAMAAISQMKLGRENVLKKILPQIEKNYDFIIIDCQPSLDILPLNALVAANEIIITAQPDALSKEGAQALVETIAEIKEYGLNHNLKITGILITMCDKRTKEARNMIDDFKSSFGKYVKIFDAEIPYSTKVRESNRKGKSVLQHAPFSKAAQEYEKFTKEII